MANLSFTIERVEAEKFSATPLLLFSLRMINAEQAQRIENIELNCQIRLEPTQRVYSPSERERLAELFGAPERWGETLRSLLWTQIHVSVPGFEREKTVQLPVPCTHDFNIASAKYFYGLNDGDAPLSFLFSGSLFYKDACGDLQIEQIPWSKEARFRLPVAIWRDLMNAYYPNAELLRVSAEIFNRLNDFKRRNGLLSFDDTLHRLLRNVEVDAT
ncbi:DUF6084 family protein [Methylocystis sp. IM3]